MGALLFFQKETKSSKNYNNHRWYPILCQGEKKSFMRPDHVYENKKCRLDLVFEKDNIKGYSKWPVFLLQLHCVRGAFNIFFYFLPDTVWNCPNNNTSAFLRNFEVVFYNNIFYFTGQTLFYPNIARMVTSYQINV